MMFLDTNHDSEYLSTEFLSFLILLLMHIPANFEQRPRYWKFIVISLTKWGKNYQKCLPFIGILMKTYQEWIHWFGLTFFRKGSSNHLSKNKMAFKVTEKQFKHFLTKNPNREKRKINSNVTRDHFPLDLVFFCRALSFSAYDTGDWIYVGWHRIKMDKNLKTKFKAWPVIVNRNQSQSNGFILFVSIVLILMWTFNGWIVLM